MMATTGYVSIDEGRLFYESRGEGPSVVLIHGFTLDLRMWDEQFDELAKSCRITRYDARGFGKSSIPTQKEYAHWSDLAVLMEQLDLGPSILVGLSMGGRIASQFTVQSPQLVSGLVLVDASMNAFPYVEYKKISESVAAAFRAGGVTLAKQTWRDSSLFAAALAQPRVAKRLYQMVDDYSGWHWEAEQNPVPSLPVEVRYRLNEIKAPTLVVVGEKDLADFHGIANAYADGISGARRHVLPNVGHLAPMEGPEQFNALLMAFLRDLQSA